MGKARGDGRCRGRAAGDHQDGLGARRDGRALLRKLAHDLAARQLVVIVVEYLRRKAGLLELGERLALSQADDFRDRHERGGRHRGRTAGDHDHDARTRRDRRAEARWRRCGSRREQAAGSRRQPQLRLAGGTASAAAGTVSADLRRGQGVWASDSAAGTVGFRLGRRFGRLRSLPRESDASGSAGGIRSLGLGRVVRVDRFARRRLVGHASGSLHSRSRTAAILSMPLFPTRCGRNRPRAQFTRGPFGQNPPDRSTTHVAFAADSGARTADDRRGHEGDSATHVARTAHDDSACGAGHGTDLGLLEARRQRHQGRRQPQTRSS